MKTQLKKEEKLILVTQPHWFTLILPVLLTMAVSVGAVLIGSYALYALIPIFGYLIYKLVERRNNIWAVTNLRVIDEFGVFSNNSKESPLDKINNVSYQQSFWGKMFGFGNVEIQTAAEVGATVYTWVQGPARLKDAITRMQEEYKSYQMRKQAAEMASAMAVGQQNNRIDVPGELEKLYNLKQRGIITEAEYNARKAKLLNS